MEDKLISIKNLVLKHASSSDFTSFIEEMRDEMENLPGDMQPSKIMHDEKRLDRVLKENRNLVMRSKELEIKLDARVGFLHMIHLLSAGRALCPATGEGDQGRQPHTQPRHHH